MNDWLSKHEDIVNEVQPDDDNILMFTIAEVRQMARVLRELAGYIKHEAEHAYYQEVIACDMEDFTDETKEKWIENWYDNFSNDVKELCVATKESP